MPSLERYVDMVLFISIPLSIFSTVYIVWIYGRKNLPAKWKYVFVLPLFVFVLALSAAVTGYLLRFWM